jgi:hypothetical protein
MEQQHQNAQSDFKRDFNVACWVAMIYQRALVIPLRKNFGTEAFGLPTALAFVLMCFWASLSMDQWMWLWIFLWVVALIGHRAESKKLAASGVRVHSQYDGVCREALFIGRTERAAKVFIEPAIVAIIGIGLYHVYLAYGLPVTGLPAFFLGGVVALPFVALLQQRIWDKRMTAISDARIESEQMVQEMKQRYGE